MQASPFQEVLTLRGWLDRQEWKDTKMKTRLGEMLNAQLTRLESLVTNHQVQPVSAHALG
jgi:hypothetical protein